MLRTKNRCRTVDYNEVEQIGVPLKPCSLPHIKTGNVVVQADN